MVYDGIFEIFRDKETNESQPASTGSSYRQETSSSYNPSITVADSRTFVLSVGGSTLMKEKINTAFIGKLSYALSQLRQQGYNFVIVVGGGKTAREYVAAGKALGATNNYALDELGIQATRLNGLLLIQALENAVPQVLTDLHQAKGWLEKGKIPVYGGLIPGYTTDSIGALLCEILNATFINLTNVDGVYSADPKENPEAKHYPEMSHNELIKIIARSTGLGAIPSQNVILDLPCALILKRSNIKTMILDAQELENLENAVQGLEFKGTLIED